MFRMSLVRVTGENKRSQLGERGFFHPAEFAQRKRQVFRDLTVSVAGWFGHFAAGLSVPKPGKHGKAANGRNQRGHSGEVIRNRSHSYE